MFRVSCVTFKGDGGEIDAFEELEAIHGAFCETLGRCIGVDVEDIEEPTFLLRWPLRGARTEVAGLSVGIAHLNLPAMSAARAKEDDVYSAAMPPDVNNALTIDDSLEVLPPKPSRLPPGHPTDVYSAAMPPDVNNALTIDDSLEVLTPKFSRPPPGHPDDVYSAAMPPEDALPAKSAGSDDMPALPAPERELRKISFADPVYSAMQLAKKCSKPHPSAPNVEVDCGDSYIYSNDNGKDSYYYALWLRRSPTIVLDQAGGAI